MEGEKVGQARRNEVGYCGEYCRTCHWHTDALRKPAAQLLDLLKSHFEVAGWINYKGGSSEETMKGLEILSKCACAFNCKGGGGWSGCPVRKCALEGASISASNVQSFHAKEIGMKKVSMLMFLRLIR